MYLVLLGRNDLMTARKVMKASLRAGKTMMTPNLPGETSLRGGPRSPLGGLAQSLVLLTPEKATNQVNHRGAAPPLKVV